MTTDAQVRLDAVLAECDAIETDLTGHEHTLPYIAAHICLDRIRHAAGAT